MFGSQRRPGARGYSVTVAAVLLVAAACSPPAPTVDITPPELELPGDLTFEAVDESGVEVGWSATAVDLVDGVVAVDCSPGPGVFSVGTTTVACSATDAAGNISAGSFTVTVMPRTRARVTQVAAGHSHTCALIADGTVRCWGDGGLGQLGNGATATSNTPVQVTGLSNAVAVSAGDGFSCALVDDGTVKCWGSDSLGKLGNGSSVGSSSVPTAVVSVQDATAIAAGGGHACAALSDGRAMCWGRNDLGQIGNTVFPFASPPWPVENLAGAVDVELGTNHSCATLTTGSVSCWGRNDLGQTGPTHTRWVGISGLQGVQSVGSGSDHSCPTLGDGTVRCFGSNSGGQLGAASAVPAGSLNTVSGLSDAAQTSGGGQFSCAVSTTGEVRCWGSNTYGSLGNGTTTDSTSPVLVSGLGDALEVSAGFNHACALLDGGFLRCWGHNAQGRLGHGEWGQQSTVPVEPLLPI